MSLRSTVPPCSVIAENRTAHDYAWRILMSHSFRSAARLSNCTCGPSVGRDLASVLGLDFGPGPAERLAAQVLLAEGFEGVDPSHPLGGPDGGKDLVCRRADTRFVGAVYFPRGQQPFTDVRSKFESDLRAAQERSDAEGFIFVTNQELRLAERRTLQDLWPERVELFHLERVAAILDQPALDGVRRQFLGIARDSGGRGGDGGSGTVVGDRGVVVGGRGGRGGAFGRGGDGGGGTVIGDDARVIGGDGGDSGSADGRGGCAARGPTERYGFDTPLWGYGRGGRGGDAPEYIRRLELLTRIREEYLSRFPGDAPYIAAGIDVVPVDWVNQRLDELGEAWHVAWGLEGYELPALPD